MLEHTNNHTSVCFCVPPIDWYFTINVRHHNINLTTKAKKSYYSISHLPSTPYFIVWLFGVKNRVTHHEHTVDIISEQLSCIEWWYARSLCRVWTNHKWEWAICRTSAVSCPILFNLQTYKMKCFTWMGRHWALYQLLIQSLLVSSNTVVALEAAACDVNKSELSLWQDMLHKADRQFGR